jgi:hypothetical protein
MIVKKSEPRPLEGPQRKKNPPVSLINGIAPSYILITSSTHGIRTGRLGAAAHDHQLDATIHLLALASLAIASMQATPDYRQIATNFALEEKKYALLLVGP